MDEQTTPGPRQHRGRGPEPGSEQRSEQSSAALVLENRRLRHELQALASEAEKNEKIFRRFHALELAMLDAGSLPGLLGLMVQGTRDRLRLEQVTLRLHDPNQEIRGLLQTDALPLPVIPGLRLTDAPPPWGLPIGPRASAWLGPYRREHRELFSPGRRFGSVAVLPLAAQGILFGSLNLASADPNRYTSHHASDFLVHLAGVASLCLQNALNRERLVVSSYTDLLTGWQNRRYLDQRLPQEVARAIRYREPLCCLMLDLDHFKRINDQHGHPAGDQVLRKVADRIKGQLRSSDLRVRYGGEELAVFLIRTTEPDAVGVAERIRRGVADSPIDLPGGERIKVTLSGGISPLEAADRSADPASLGAAMLQRADQALYRAKAAGRDRIVATGSLEPPRPSGVGAS
ncbi:MAG: GGDEF domain-containing protein [Bdellovibrio bacteriovorus]